MRPAFSAFGFRVSFVIRHSSFVIFMTFPPPSERQARVIWLAVTGFAIAMLVALVAALVWGLGRLLDLLSPVLWPLAVAGVLAYLLDPVVDWLERRKVPRTRAIVTVFCLAGAVVLGLLGSVVPYLVVETRQLVTELPDYTSRLQKQAEDWINNPPTIIRNLFPQTGKTNPDAAAAGGWNLVGERANQRRAVDCTGGNNHSPTGRRGCRAGIGDRLGGESAADGRFVDFAGRFLPGFLVRLARGAGIDSHLRVLFPG